MALNSRLIRYALALAAAQGLIACQSKTMAVKPDPIPEGCDALCRTPCEIDQSIAYKPDPYKDALDELVRQVVTPLIGEVKQCDAHRVACVQCLDRLKQAGVTR